MSDYIKREDAIRSIADHDEFKGERWIKEAWADYMIEDAQPVEVVPVRHGRWIEHYKSDAPPTLKERWICSWCGNVQTYGATGYCPNCGAKMDEEE